MSNSRLAGYLLAAMIAFSLLSNISGAYQNHAYALSGMCACFSAFLLFGKLGASAKVQVFASKLWVPVLLTVAVLSTQIFIPMMSILVAISLFAILLTMVGPVLKRDA